MPEVYNSSTAAANITKMFDSIVEAQKSSMDAKNEIFKYQLKQKMDLEQKKQEQQLEVQKPIQQMQAWNDFGNGLNEAGKSNNQTNQTVGTVPPLQGQPVPQLPGQPAPQTPPMTMLNPAQQPQNDAASQLTMPSASAPVQPPQGQPSPQGQPPMSVQPPAPSVQYTNLGYQPVEAQQLVAARKQQGQNINMSDVSYIQALQKAKAGTASQAELEMIHKMNNRDEQGNPVVPKEIQVGSDPNPALVQSNPGLARLEKMNNYPPGSLTIDLATGNPVLNPIIKSKIEARQRAEEIAAVNRPYQEEGRQKTLQNEVISRISNVRGDTSIKNIETQRDSTILAYKTLQDCKDMGRLPTQFEYNDILGQIWKARTGAAPTNEVMASLNTPNVEQNLRKLYTGVTGDPASGYSTQKIISSLENFVKKTGLQLDKMHAAYMDDHVIKPPGMDKTDFDAIVSKAHRGQSFKEAMEDNGEQGGTDQGGNGQYQEGQTATNPKTGQTLTYRGGKWQ